MVFTVNSRMRLAGVRASRLRFSSHGVNYLPRGANSMKEYPNPFSLARVSFPLCESRTAFRALLNIVFGSVKEGRELKLG